MSLIGKQKEKNGESPRLTGGKLKLTGRQILKISALVDKLELKIDPSADIETMGSDVILQVIKKAHKAEDEVAEVLAILFNCEPEKALDLDLMEEWNRFSATEDGKKLLGFFQSAAVSKDQD